MKYVSDFKKYWIFINLCKFKIKIRIFHKKKKLSKTGHKSKNFYGIKKLVYFLTR